MLTSRPALTRSGLRLAAAVVAAAALVVAALAFGGGGDEYPLGIPPAPPGQGPRGIADVALFDPFAFRPDRAEDFLRRGRDGLAHVLYAKSPGGVEATAARVDRFAPLIEDAASRGGVDAETLGALVFLESGGRPDVSSGRGPSGATGLAQILPETAENLLGLRVDLRASRRLTRRLERERRRARTATTVRRRRTAAARVPRLERARREVDERYDPAKALAAATRYLALAERRFGREDLAAASYHMGIGNLERVIEAYVAPRSPAASTRATVARDELSYARLYFDSSPVRNPLTYRRLTRFGDDSRHYLFRLEAAREIRRLHREDPEELARLSALHTAKASGEEVLRPRADNPPFEDADALRDAYEDGDLVRLPNDPARLGFRVDPLMGSAAAAVRAEPRLYRGVRPDALACLLFIAKEVHRIAGRSSLVVTSTVRDLPYQRVLTLTNPEATHGFSLHTTGWSIDILRDLPTRREERALVHAVERLRALHVIDWVYEPAAIHLTAGPDAERLRPLLDALVPDAA